MATIVQSMITGLDSRMVKARLNGVDVKQFQFGRYFPVLRRTGFSWKMLSDQLNGHNVAADIHADNSTIRRKRRPLLESAQGDIPFISISRELTRSQIKDYQTALAYASKDADATRLVEHWGNDVDFCFNGVNSELEYIAWASISNAGKLAFTTTNNATFANEFDLDYDVDQEAKMTVTKSWANPKTADIIGDLKKVVQEAKSRGLNPRFAFMSLDTFDLVCSSEQVMKLCTPIVMAKGGTMATPDLDEVNKMLAKQAFLNRLQIRVVDQTITRELADGTQTTGNPFENHRVVISEKETLGSTQYDLLEETNKNIITAVRSHAVVKKYGTVEPLSEITIGHADAMPVIDSVYRNMYLRTDAKSW